MLDPIQHEQEIKALHDRLSDLEIDKETSDRKQNARIAQLEAAIASAETKSRKGRQNNRWLTLGLSGLTAAAIAGISVDQGNFSWAFNQQKTQQILDFLGLLGVGGSVAATAIAVARKDDEGDRPY